ncbi:MAG TPA: GyrI-like domain-containing protein [Devosiaceae bacterium]|jgi:effector-binding domain-containing protein
MLTLPKVAERPAQPYVAIQVRTTISGMKAVIDETFPKLFAWLGSHDVKPAGAPFIKYNLINMAGIMELEFGVPTEALVAAADDVVAAELPAGRYAQLTYWGSYDNLYDVNALMIGWAKQKGISFDVEERPEGDWFASRLEIYVTDPGIERDTGKWETQLLIRVKDA